MMLENKLCRLETNLVLNAIYLRYGIDFRHYKRASLQRNIRRMQSKYNFKSISDMVPVIMRDVNFLDKILETLSVPFTEFFRDPIVFKSIREQVIPVLKTYPFIKIWHAGCATGEEIYSLAILLQEEGLYDRARIYATDINSNALRHAKEGIFPREKYEEYNHNYLAAGGKSSLDKYLITKYDAMIVDSQLKKNIFFFNHNLATDDVFGEMNLILCRNVLIYFNNQLQDKAIDLFERSLCYGGFLCLGTKESIEFLPHNTAFQLWKKQEKIYRKSSYENLKESTHELNITETQSTDGGR